MSTLQTGDRSSRAATSAPSKRCLHDLAPYERSAGGVACMPLTYLSPRGSIRYADSQKKLGPIGRVYARTNRVTSRLKSVARAEAVMIGAGGPREAIDVMSRGQFIGPGREPVRVLSSFPLLGSSWTMQEMPFWGVAGRFNGEPSPSHSFGDVSRYAWKPVSDTAISNQIELLVKCPSRSDVNMAPPVPCGRSSGSVATS